MFSACTLKSFAREAGFSLAGIARAAPLDPRPLDTWLEAGHQASMNWMASTRDVRLDPAKLLPGAKSVLALGSCYLTSAHRLDAPVIAPVAQGRDYHAVARDKLRTLRRRLHALDASLQVFSTVDTVPIHEKAWAALAGLGWMGRSGLLVTPDHGTRVILATMILDQEADAFDTPLPFGCGSCVQCLDACPTGALLGDGRLDARQCLACQTIEETKGAFRPELRPVAGPSIFGCDLCQRACPWNRPGHACNDPKFTPRPLANRRLEEWVDVSPDDFDEWTRGTALRRAGIEGIRRNARAALKVRAIRAAHVGSKDGR